MSFTNSVPVPRAPFQGIRATDGSCRLTRLSRGAGPCFLDALPITQCGGVRSLPAVGGEGTGMAGNSTESGRSVTSKITSILMTFTEGSAHSLTEIARLAGLPISTTHRLTSELASWRLLERTDAGQLPRRPAAAHDRRGRGDARRPSPNARPGSWRTSRPRPAAGPGSACWPGWRSPTSRSCRATAPSRRSAGRPRCPSRRRRWAARCSPSPVPRSSTPSSPPGCGPTPRTPSPRRTGCAARSP